MAEVVRDYIRRNKTEELEFQIQDTINKLYQEGFRVEFGNIGKKTTYAMIYNDDHEIEYVGYTFIKNLRYYNENTGKLKALQQAIARKETLPKED